MVSFLRKVLGFFTGCVVYALLAVVLFFLIEGISGAVLIGLDLYRLSGRAADEKNFIRYDPDLGWSSKPNVFIKDMYAPGVSLRINSQSFRNDQNFSPAVPPGKNRILCVGDSFTFGDGVDNENTWCQAIHTIDQNLETVNMGQGGYGIDQAYLWYKRDGLKLQHKVVIFAFIADDFRRMSPEFANKPYLIWNGNHLEVRNTPVSPGAYWSSRFSTPLSVLTRLRTYELIRMLCDRFTMTKTTKDPVEDYKNLIQLAIKVFEEVNRLAEERGAIAIFAYLPGYEEYSLKVTDPLRRILTKELKNRGLFYLDLTEELKKYKLTEVRKFYLDRKDVPFAADPETAARHFSPRGHQFVATHVYYYLVGLIKASQKTGVPEVPSLGEKAPI